MVVMYSFCFWFSVRLGSMIVGAFSLTQGLAFLILCCIGLSEKPEVSRTLKEWVKQNDLLFLEQTLDDMAKDPEGALIFFTSFAAIYVFSCLLLMYGAYRCNVLMIYPFMVLDIARLIFLSVCFVIAMNLVKHNMINLGLLIGFCVLGGFLLLYLFYMWFCTLSLCQVVRQLEEMEEFAPYNSSIEVSEYSKKLTRETPLTIDKNFHVDNGYNYLSKPIY